MFRLFRKQLYEGFFDWLDLNQKVIGEKWYIQLYNKGKDAEADCNSCSKLLANSMWMLNMIANLGVMAGVMVNRYDLQHLADGLDEKSTKRLLALMGSCFALQGLPKEIMSKEYPIQSAKHFNLGLWVKEHAAEIG